MMKHRKLQLAAVILASCCASTACSTRNWYEGAQAGHNSQCMKEPLAEYNDCVQQGETGWHEYQQSREQIKQ